MHQATFLNGNFMAQQLEFDIIIIGGGMVGQAFALGMAKTSNQTIAIVEPHYPNPILHDDFSVRVSAITPKSETFLQTVGAWDLIARKHKFVGTLQPLHSGGHKCLRLDYALLAPAVAQQYISRNQ